jgi:hypothetical protein
VTTGTKAKKKAAPAAAKPQEGTNTNGAVAAETNGHKPVPGDKRYDWTQDYPDEDVFTYTTPSDQVTTTGEPCGGVTIGLAAISQKRQPSVGFLRSVRRKPEFDQVLDMIEIVACDNALDLMDPWRPTDLQALFEQWSEWSNTTAGKS